MTYNRKLLEISLDLHKEGRSGVVRVERGLQKKQLVLNKGLLAFAESNLPEEHLVRVMVRMGLLPRARVNEIASLMKNGKTSEEAILAVSNSGIQDLEKARREQAIAILASLGAWDSCDTHYYAGEDLLRYQISLGLSFPELLLLSVRHAVSNGLISTPKSFLEGSFSIAQDFAGTAMELPLNSAESYAYSLLREQPMNSADALSLIPATDARPEEILLRLYALGLIVLNSSIVQSGGAPVTTETDSLAQLLEDMLLRFETASFYEILSIPAEASREEIQAAYYDLAKQFHPDRFQSKEYSDDICLKAQKVFTYVNEAYGTLRNPESRAVYDEMRLSTESKVEAELKARAGVQSEDEKIAAGLFREGRIFLAEGDFEKAVERLKGSVWLCPKKAAYHHYLGVAQSQIPRLRKNAEQNLLKAIELDSTHIASNLELAKLYIKVMLPRRAESHLQEFMRWDPENPEAHKLLDELKNLESGKSGSKRIKKPPPGPR
jgi:curved DNA-binding protein CbpA